MSNFIESFKKLSALDYVFVFYGFLATLSPGFLILYLYKPAFIENLETVKLLVFSFCLTSPILMVNAIAVASFSPKELDSILTSERERVQYFQKIFVASSGITFFILYILLILAYYFNFSFRLFLGVIISIETAMLLLGMFIYIRYDMKQRKNDTAEEKKLE